VGADEHPRVEVTSRAEWRKWLARNHESERGVWVVTYKKRSGGPYVSYDDLVEEALAFGWVDGRARGLDERRTQLLITPRRPTSGWSRPNKQRVKRLLESGLMAPAGQAAIDVAKRNGSWSALDDVENLVEPAELKEALDSVPAARRNWDAFPRSAKRAILEWISTAKRPETRARRISEAARLAAENVRANQ
jgi:uncharacterized protein YdeI (YjbR/CyaY-like superfamily)